MKNLLKLTTSIAIFTVGANAIPDGYKTINNQETGSKTYLSNNGNIAVIEAPTGKSRITFGVGKEGGINNNDHRTFKRMSITSHCNLYDYGDLYMALNGQFFGWSKYSPLSFNVKADGNLLQDKVLEEGSGKRLLSILNGKYPVFYKGKIKTKKDKQINKKEIQEQIVNLLQKDVITDGITGLDPFDSSKNPTAKIGRNMIGCIPYKKYDLDYIALCKKVYFFIGKKIKHEDMMDEMRKWGVKDSYMLGMDGSGSAQAYTTEFKYKNKNFRMPGDSRTFPNSILIYSK